MRQAESVSSTSCRARGGGCPPLSYRFLFRLLSYPDTHIIANSPQDWRRIPLSAPILQSMPGALFAFYAQNQSWREAEAALTNCTRASQLLRQHWQTIPRPPRPPPPPLSHSRSGVSSYFLAQRSPKCPGPWYSESRGTRGGTAETSATRNPWRLKQARRPPPLARASSAPSPLLSKTGKQPREIRVRSAHCRARALFLTGARRGRD